MKLFQSLKKLFLNERFIFLIILLNSFTIFLDGFDEVGAAAKLAINIVDTVFTLVFIVEAIVKISHFGWHDYIHSRWNQLDFVLIILSLPSLMIFVDPEQFGSLSFLLVLRITRVFRFFKFFRFIPGIEALLHGISRAMKASVFVLIGFFIFNFIIAILSCYMFRNYSPEMFGDPLTAFYSIFRVFTVEGWYEIPDQLSQNASPYMKLLVKTYFVVILIVGGIMGLSLVNSIFVDSMVMDNNEDLEKQVDELNTKVDRLLIILDQKNKEQTE